MGKDVAVGEFLEPLSIFLWGQKDQVHKGGWPILHSVHMAHFLHARDPDLKISQWLEMSSLHVLSSVLSHLEKSKVVFGEE